MGCQVHCTLDHGGEAAMATAAQYQTPATAAHCQKVMVTCESERRANSRLQNWQELGRSGYIGKRYTHGLEAVKGQCLAYESAQPGLLATQESVHYHKV